MASVNKGDIDAGEIVATFRAGPNTGTATLRMTYVPTGGTGVMKREAVAPNGQKSVSLTANAEGMLDVWVDVGAASDGGHLTVTSNGVVQDAEDLIGPWQWAYLVVK